MVFENTVVKELVEKTRVLWAIGHALALMGWDTETYMPSEGAEERGIASGELSVLRQKILLSPEIKELVEKAAAQEGLNDYERGVVRVMKRALRIAGSIPPRLTYERARISREAVVVWRKARERDDYEMFKPYLKRIVEINREIAEHLGYEDHPYDALLDLYEEGLRTRDVERIFNELEPGIRRVYERIREEGRYPERHPLEEQRYRREDMERLVLEVLGKLGFPLGRRSRLDVSAHPFTESIGVRDVRITTRYEGIDFKRALFSTIHEFGHALYELQIDERLIATPLASGVSLGIHESQSRFWENMIGRSHAFVEAIHPLITKHLDFTRGYSVDDIYMYFNTVRPGLIRVDADEVTYNLHILLRFRLEKMLVAGEISVDDLPELWNDEMERLLGVRPKSYRDGVLQDIHWSMAMIGYFPTYTLGNLVSAQIRRAVMREIPGFYDMVRELRFDEVKRFLREKIHRWGSTFAPKELLRRSLGAEYEAGPFIEYLEEKYLGR